MGGNTKALTSAIQHVKGLKDKAALLVTVDKEPGKVNHMSVVAQVCHIFSLLSFGWDSDPVVYQSLNDKGLKASEWAAVMSEQVGGKCGGNAAAAQGAGTQTDKVDVAVGLAQEFAAKLLLK